MRPRLGCNSGARYQRSPWRIIGAIFARFPSQKTRLGLQGSSEAIRSMTPSGKIQPAVTTTASFVGALWVEVLLLPAGMVCPKSDTAEPFGCRSRKNSELQTKLGLLCGIVSTLVQTVTNLKTYAFEDLNRIPEVNTAQS